jgi:hypothetical protein
VSNPMKILIYDSSYLQISTKPLSHTSCPKTPEKQNPHPRA